MNTIGTKSALDGFPSIQRLASSYPSLLSKEWDGALPVGIFMTLHAVRVAYEVRKGMQINGRSGLLQELFVMLTFSFGGAILTGLALGRPQAWLENNLTVPVYSLAYVLMSRMPGDMLYWALRQASPVSDVFLASVDGLIRGFGVTAAGVDMVRKGMAGQPIADSLVAWVFVGTVMGSGGGIIDDFLQISRSVWNFRTPDMLRTGLSLDIKLSFAATVGYIVSTHAWSFAERAPGFPLSSLLDSLLHAVPRITEQEAHLLSGLLCSAVLGTAAHAQAKAFAAAERNAQLVARAKKTDALLPDDASDSESDSDEDIEN
ncbi:hypothetical protein H4R99_001484 [Coemansia sp. RSA 1722]|nr:hypothetical protein IWW45_004951 [Coemansia sp. RSA 485]KAJ2595457.1 hypothetical protein GGF39_003816 [Coemansia sp. RSA 1721]KAJ2604954.1 hypothetical protein H4R99_001484 [Coemansia sp. RSA 1722]